jgi:hypothetical protein
LEIVPSNRVASNGTYAFAEEIDDYFVTLDSNNLNNLKA